MIPVLWDRQRGMCAGRCFCSHARDADWTVVGGAWICCECNEVWSLFTKIDVVWGGGAGVKLFCVAFHHLLGHAGRYVGMAGCNGGARWVCVM